MATLTERTAAGAPAEAVAPRNLRSVLALLLAIAGAGIGLWGVTLASEPRSDDVLAAILVVIWAGCGSALTLRRPTEPVGFLMTAWVLFGGLWVFGHAVGDDPSRSASRDLAEGALWLSLGFLPALGAHLVAGMPDGRLRTRAQRGTIISLYVSSVAVAAVLWSTRPSPLWPVILSTALVVTIAGGISTGRYRRTRGLERQRMQWFGWAATVGAGTAFIALASRVLISWPDDAVAVAVVATLPVPIALVFGGTKRASKIDRLLTHTVSVAGLVGVVVLVYLVIVVGLGRIPSERERTLLGLSMAAAVIAAILYLPTRERLTALATRIVYGERHAPDEVLRTFGSRMSRAVPMDELLLQAAESLRKTFSLDAVEIWTGQAGALERAASVPERGGAHMTIGAKEQPVLSRAGVSGPAWIEVWLPELLKGREGSAVRIAPVTHQGELLGLIIVERRHTGETFGQEEERVLTELARTIGLALHNVQLDSALQASLEELKKQAEDLRASRQRVVAAGDAERRRIERNIHDGAQQHLTAMKVKVRLVQQLSERDPEQAKTMLEQLGEDIQSTIQEVRDLSHGIYPPLLADRGLVAALEAASQRQVLPTRVDANTGDRRYGQDVEAAVYFCCLEALQNATKHAGGAAEVRVHIHEEAGALLFEVSDNGPGIDLAARGLGAGYTNMSDRIGAVGGTVTWESAPGKGMKVAGRIPLSDG